MGKKKNITDAQIEEALYAHYGNRTKAGEALGVTRQALCYRIKDNTRLQEAQTTAEERILDLAENSLWKLVQDGNLGAIIFTLKCKGRPRGWIETNKLEMGGGVEIGGKLKSVVVLPPKTDDDG